VSNLTGETVCPESVAEVAQCVLAHSRLKIVGAATKSAMVHHEPNVTPMSLKSIAGIVDHQPSEFLITAFAGTTIDEMQTELAKFGQYLPFDPPFAAQGATIGGTVAAGLSGAGRLRFGGLRDFIVGIRVVDGLGNVVTGGGRVVKNAAGYDLPKLMVGSAGYLAAIVEVGSSPDGSLHAADRFGLVRESVCFGEAFRSFAHRTCGDRSCARRSDLGAS
jgi:glycolate oxidase FAD binding subunit